MYRFWHSPLPCVMADIQLDTDVQFLKGVGPDRARKLAKLGIQTVEDLLWYLPRDILDFTQISSPEQLTSDQPATVRGLVCDLDARTLPRNRTLSSVLIDCRTDFVRASWFNQPWMLKRFQPGQAVLFSGKPKFRQGRWEMAHPHVQWIDPDEIDSTEGAILTRYRLTEGLRVQELRSMVASALEYVPLVNDNLPESFLAERKLPGLPTALRGVHQPQSVEEYHASRRRILFDDLFEFQLGLALRRHAWRRRSQSPQLPRTAKIDARIRRLFPFPYTAGQNAAVRQIADDLNSGIAMHRLLQADVGAGKTLVAIDTMLTAVAHGWQAAVMAPTETLASQHWQTIDAALSHSRVNRALLTGSVPNRERQRILAGLADGSMHLVVGTQALIQAGVQFAKLGVAVIDEQHKFGVAQRADFSSTSEQAAPHVLVMTATPIPRTVCMTQFGDLDVSTIKDRPPGRQMVVTSKIAGTQARQKAWSFLTEKLREGRQLFVICPLVEERESDESGSETAAAEQVFRTLQQSELRDFHVGLVHGRMKADARESVMQAFRERDLEVLVATTVVEVGVDIPNATLMTILDAERFGLSQLHQLRGRVARGKFRGYCFLFSESNAPEALARLAVLERSSDGFDVAEQDFQLRGPGDILGTRQHGALPLRFANELRDDKILELTREDAFDLVNSGQLNAPEFKALKTAVLARFARLLDLPRSG